MDGIVSLTQNLVLRIGFVLVELFYVGFEDVVGVAGCMSITVRLGFRRKVALFSWRGL